MTASLIALVAALRSLVRSRLEFQAEILALRHELAVAPGSGVTAPWAPPRRSPPVDAALTALVRLAPGGLHRLARHGGALAAARVHARLALEVPARRPGRPALGTDLRTLIQQMQRTNPLIPLARPGRPGIASEDALKTLDEVVNWFPTPEICATLYAYEVAGRAGRSLSSERPDQ